MSTPSGYYFCKREYMLEDFENQIKEKQLSNALKPIGELTNQRARTLESLHRHVTMLSSTLLGILAVFGAGESTSRWFRWALALGAMSLFLCLLSGIYCIWQYYKVLDGLVKLQSENYRKRGMVRPEQARFPRFYESVAGFCPAIFCIGILFLLCAVLLRLDFFQS